MQTISLLLATKNSAERLPFLLDGIRRIVDEIVIGVDDSSTDNTLEVTRGLADTYVSVKSAGYVESFLYQLFPLCKGDWILRIDDDEFLSRQWAKECITDLDPKLCKA
jgi:glycosyltransferase involved in cell wall biosynthesis